ncbi:MAG: phosphopentomutase [Calditrichaceae bacterium]|nr:phosphopentomutase [Calditrichaceae bacterium]MBN2710088.1 phosphopentomutase [Calditrichaceae bacterium]RQV94257.1 MAG: phosphopentomutase [Calditrichota bacterium]
MAKKKKRAVVIILDGVGIGEMPDASAYGDAGSNTLANLATETGGFNLPSLESLGLGKIVPIKGLRNDIRAQGAYGKMAEKSAGKDSTTGHWELAGLILDKPFPTYPNGFPEEIINSFKEKTGLGILGNIPASGTEIIKDLGEEHVRTGKPIIYTSADSVFQIAAHEDIIPVDELYRICQISREILSGEHAVARVIARPFVGTSSADFQRTRNRKDFSLKPPGTLLHENLSKAGYNVVGIGKINDLYAGVGLTKNIHAKSNEEGMKKLLQELAIIESGLIMINLVDFDMLWGHRNDVTGFYQGLKEFDVWLPLLISNLKQDDIAIITADHGNDPTTPSTDHSREYVLLLIFGPPIKEDINIGVRTSFTDLQATLAGYFNVPSTGNGQSFLDLLILD